jgi:hypothetical protein
LKSGQISSGILAAKFRMRQAALAGGARKPHLDRFDDAGRAVRGHQQRVVEPPHLHVLEERGYCLGIFLGPRHQMQQHAAALNHIAPGRQYWLALGARTQPLGNAVNEQIGDLVFAQVALGEGLVILPQPLPSCDTAVFDNSSRPLSSLNASSMSRTDSPRANISIAKSSSPCV